MTTTVARYGGCAASAVELWSVQGGSHVPALANGWSEPFWDFLSAQSKH